MTNKLIQTTNLTIEGKKEKELGYMNVIGYGGFGIDPANSYYARDRITKHYDLSAPGEYEIIVIQQVVDRKNKKTLPVRSGVLRIQISTPNKP